ncbi:MAG TPA: hypothetical protein VJQ54_17065 [Candidatus Sulfotelmatobacter sp.]|nr:hypothetical protein [Candidatus Sulfotelmatobacter sp.]
MADAIEMTEFSYPAIGLSGQAIMSPDGRFAAFVTARGLLADNVIEYSLWLWPCNEVGEALKKGASAFPTRSPVIRMTSRESRHVITDLQWRQDSSALIFKGEVSPGHYRLFYVDSNSSRVLPLSGEDENVGEYGKFDARNGNVVYTTIDPRIGDARRVEQSREEIVGTGASIHELVFPDSQLASVGYDWGELWAVVGGRRFQIDTTAFQKPLHLNRWLSTQTVLAISPDGRSVVTALPVASVPPEWALYASASGTQSSVRLAAGKQSLDTKSAEGLASQFVVIGVTDGSVRPLLNAPDGYSGGFNKPMMAADWSPDGGEVAVTNTFMPISGVAKQPFDPRPCLAVVRISTGDATCVEPLTFYGDRDHRLVGSFRFDSHDKNRLIVRYSYLSPGTDGGSVRTYRRSGRGEWRREQSSGGNGASQAARHSIEMKVQQTPNDPPRLVALDREGRRQITLLDPNAHLRNKRLGNASKFVWRDAKRRDWLGVVVTPPDYVPGLRYPLVIQAHGYPEDMEKFVASGSFTSAFAARPLAAAGIVVLQINSDWSTCPLFHAEEVECELAGYKAAVDELQRRGLIDHQRVGIIGFSRTSLYALAALADARFKFAAATINDGVMLSYMQYMLSVDFLDNADAGWMNSMVGAPPIGDGLMRWTSASPALQVDKIRTPLRFESVGRFGALYMWEPYAALRYLRRPVDLIMLRDEGTHPLTSPAQRLASQGGNVDWFRFWLLDHVDPDPTKAGQYVRWTKLRELTRPISD